MPYKESCNFEPRSGTFCRYFAVESVLSQKQKHTKIIMNSLSIALFFCLAVASNVQAGGEQWSGSVKMQIARHASSSTCSDQAMDSLSENVGEWLQNEMLTLLGSEDAFRLGVVQGTGNDGKISLTASLDCLDCSQVVTKKSISKVLMVFMQHRKDVWLLEAGAAMQEGCVGEHTTVSRVMVTDASPLTLVHDIAGRASTRKSRSAIFDAKNASETTCDSPRENFTELIPNAGRSSMSSYEIGS
jgi:hypothetical protein